MARPPARRLDSRRPWPRLIPMTGFEWVVVGFLVSCPAIVGAGWLLSKVREKRRGF